VWSCPHPEFSFSPFAAHHNSRPFIDIMHIRLRVVAHALNAGYNVLLSDADAVFVSPVPFRHEFARDFRYSSALVLRQNLQVLPLVHAAMFPNGQDSSSDDDEPVAIEGDNRRGEAVDLVVCVDTPDGGGKDGVMVMAGFWAARRCTSSIDGDERASKNTDPDGKACRFLADVLLRCQTTDDAHDQHSFNIVLSNYAKRRLISFAFFDAVLFLNGTFFVNFTLVSCSNVLQGPLISLKWSSCVGNQRIPM
jgi:hypothetical protein